MYLPYSTKNINYLEIAFLSNEDIAQQLRKIAPEPIEKDLPTFLERAKRSFIDLDKVEQYITRSIDDSDSLWRLFDDLNIFRVNERYEIFDTKENKLHAEMRLLNHYFQNQQIPSYIGITKLCCAHCNWVMQRSSNARFSGGHAKVYLWIFLAFLLQDTQLERLLGTPLFDQYKSMANNTILLDRKPIIKSDAFLGIIASITSLNSNDIIDTFKLGRGKLWHDALEHADESDDDLAEVFEHTDTASSSMPVTSSSSSSSVIPEVPTTMAYFSAPLSPHLLSHSSGQRDESQETSASSMNFLS